MLPIQFILLLILVTLPGQLAQAGEGQLPAPHFISAPLAYASLILMHILLAAFTLLKARQAIRRLHEPTSAATPVSTSIDRVFSRARWMTAAITGIHLFGTPLGASVANWSESTQLLKFFLLPELLFLMPAVLTWLILWVAGYYLEAAIRERSLPYQLARALPVHEMPSLASYLIMQMRHNFYPFLFLLFQGFIRALGGGIALSTGHTQDTAEIIATICTGLVLFLLLPFLLTKIWSTTPLVGALRTRLDAVANRYGLRFRNILLWRSHNIMINAAIVGWVPWTRYFLMSDALVESFSDEQLESVFAHEVGHGIHHHLHWLMAAIISAVFLAAGVTGLAMAPFTLDFATYDMVSLIVSSALLCLLAGGAVWLISPRFEHQADWFASRHMALKLRESGGAVTAALAGTLDRALASAPTAAEAVTVAQYVAGNYPHSVMAPGASMSLAGGAAAPPAASPLLAPAPQIAPTPAATTPAPVYAAHTVELAGAEIFATALESIVETSHRDRTRRGMFHPSIADRTHLVRQLATDPQAEARFNQNMRRTRWAILALATLAAATCTASLFIPGPPTPASQPTSQSSQSAPHTASQPKP